MPTWLEAGGALVTHTSAQGPRGLQILVTQGLLHSPICFGSHSLHCLPNRGSEGLCPWPTHAKAFRPPFFLYQSSGNTTF